MILVHGVTINKKGGITVESILTSIKLLLGITEDYDYFDAQIITHINSVFMILTQLGVGPPEGFIINDKSNTWNEFIQDGKNLELVKSYVHLKVRTLFDPPSSSVVMESTNRMINEFEWRLNAAAEYSREKFKGSGTPDLYCTPHLLNVMLLARDLNGRRIYDSKSDLAAALNVGEIHTVEQFEGLQREDSTGKKHKMLGLFVNLADYQFGSTKGGEVTKFEDFDMDFNRYKYMLETRLSGSLIKLYSAIALEEPVA